MELNKIYQCDVLEGLRQLDDDSIDLIITSPPYNKAGLVGKKKRRSYDIWEKNIDYTSDIDNMPEYYYGFAVLVVSFVRLLFVNGYLTFWVGVFL